MCDYSLEAVASRQAKLDDTLFVHKFRSGTRGFALRNSDVCEETAICLREGTEIEFIDRPVYYHSPNGSFRRSHSALATFFKQDTDALQVHRDALRFADGLVITIHQLIPGQHARVLQLPARFSIEKQLREHDLVA